MPQSDNHPDQAMHERIEADLRDSLDEEVELELDDHALEQFRTVKPLDDGRPEIDRPSLFQGTVPPAG